ncbi:MAG: hypothetical protein ACI4RR_08965, partial [Eubacterium sp.]
MKNWVVYTESTPSQITQEAGKIILSNSLVRREIELQGCKTVSFYNKQKDIELIDAPCGDFQLSVDKKIYSAEDFEYSDFSVVPCEERVPFKKSSTMTYQGEYPPKGKAIKLNYTGKALPLNVTVRYEIYDGMPVVMKRLTVKNASDGSLTVDNITADLMHITQNRDTLFVDSDYNSTTQFLGLELSKYAKNYARFRYEYLEVAPLYRMNVKLEKDEEL